MNDERTRWYSRSGVWFWSVIALGAALRLYLVLFTEGTRDVAIWEQRARLAGATWFLVAGLLQARSRGSPAV